eukprot:2278417-Alexandrium_andersonii.AAC.1
MRAFACACTHACTFCTLGCGGSSIKGSTEQKAATETSLFAPLPPLHHVVRPISSCSGFATAGSH